MNLTIKRLPDEVGENLKRAATFSGRSLNAEIIQVLKAAADEAERRRRMRDSQADLDRFVASLPPMPDLTHLIREDRDSH